MEATVNKQAAIDGYAAFGAMDAEGAMKDISDSIEWVVSGDSSLTGNYSGKDEVGGLWTKLLEKGFRTTPTEFIAEAGSVDVLSYDVMEWWVRAGSLAFPLTDRPVGDRRSMPDD